MGYLIDTLEGRLQVRIGQLIFENEVLKQQLSDAYKQIEDLKSNNQDNEE